MFLHYLNIHRLRPLIFASQGLRSALLIWTSLQSHFVLSKGEWIYDFTWNYQRICLISKLGIYYNYSSETPSYKDTRSAMKKWSFRKSELAWGKMSRADRNPWLAKMRGLSLWMLCIVCYHLFSPLTVGMKFKIFKLLYFMNKWVIGV
jgi:hypothetical protein